METKVLIFCECSSGCPLQVFVLNTEYQKMRNHGYHVIIEGCQKGPEPPDILVEKRQGYSVYKSCY